MSEKLNSAIAVIGIDIGKNSFHLVGQDRRGSIVLRQMPRRAVTIDQRDHAGHVAETVRPNVLSGSHKQHARHAPRRGCVDALDMRVRHGRAQHEGMRHSR